MSTIHRLCITCVSRERQLDKDAMSAEERVREHDTSFMYYLSSCHVDKLKPHDKDAMSAEEGVREHDTSFMYYLSSCHVDKCKPHA